MLKLYQAGNSICTQKILITLAEKGLTCETRNIDLFNNEQYGPAYIAINPKGVVPALDHDGRIITESTLICEYLDDTFPDPRLIPASPYSRARMRRWSKTVDEGLFEATRELSFSAMFRDKLRNMSPGQREGRFRNVGDPNKRALFMSTYQDGVDSSFVLQGIAAFEVAFTDMETILGAKEVAEGKRWLVDDAMTLADINMMPFVARLAYLDLLDMWIDNRPAVSEWWRTVQGLASFRTAISDVLTSAEREAMSTSGRRIKAQVGERRHDYVQYLQQG